MEEQSKKNGVTTDDIMNFLVEHMATKEELQYEVGKLRSDMIDHMDKNKNILSPQEAGMILKMEPFPIS